MSYLFGPRCLHPKVVLFNLREDIAVDCDGCTFSSREVTTLQDPWADILALNVCTYFSYFSLFFCRVLNDDVKGPNLYVVKHYPFSSLPRLVPNRELKHARFWDADGNRKWAVFPFNLSSRNHIYIATYLFTIRDDNYKNVGDTTVLAPEMFSSCCRPRLKNSRA